MSFLIDVIVFSPSVWHYDLPSLLLLTQMIKNIENTFENFKMTTTVIMSCTPKKNDMILGQTMDWHGTLILCSGSLHKNTHKHLIYKSKSLKSHPFLEENQKWYHSRTPLFLVWCLGWFDFGKFAFLLNYPFKMLKSWPKAWAPHWRL